jgi:hypothetical protein
METRALTGTMIVSILTALTTMLAAVPSMAQQITGVPGSPSATITIDGKYLPPPPPAFGGTQIKIELILSDTLRSASGGGSGHA